VILVKGFFFLQKDEKKLTLLRGVAPERRISTRTACASKSAQVYVRVGHRSSRRARRKTKERLKGSMKMK